MILFDEEKNNPNALTESIAVKKRPIPPKTASPEERFFTFET